MFQKWFLWNAAPRTPHPHPARSAFGLHYFVFRSFFFSFENAINGPRISLFDFCHGVFYTKTSMAEKKVEKLLKNRLGRGVGWHWEVCWLSWCDEERVIYNGQPPNHPVTTLSQPMIKDVQEKKWYSTVTKNPPNMVYFIKIKQMKLCFLLISIFTPKIWHCRF